MQSSKRPTKAQQDWQDWVRSTGCASCGRPAAIHHAVGSTGKHNKVYIGHWWVIPLCDDYCHKVPFGIHGDMSALNTRLGRKDYEKTVFQTMAREFELDYGYQIVPDDVIAAIQDYRR